MGTVNYGQKLAGAIASQLSRDQKQPDFKRLALQNELPWCFVISRKTHRISGETGLFPTKATPGERSKAINANGRGYWDCVSSSDHFSVVHVGLPAHRSLLSRLANPADNYDALWTLGSLLLVITLAFFLCDRVYTRPLNRARLLITTALKTHREALKDLPETLPAKAGVSEIKDLTQAMADLAVFYAAQEKENTLAAQTKRQKSPGKKPENEPIILTPNQASVPTIAKSISAKHSANAPVEADQLQVDGPSNANLQSFPRDAVRRIRQEIDDENIIVAYISIEGQSKFRILESTCDSDADKVLLESFIAKSETAVQTILMREAVQISDKSLGQYGLADLKSRMQISKLCFFEIFKDKSYWEGLLVAMTVTQNAFPIEMKQLQRLADKQKQLRTMLLDQEGKDRSRWLDAESGLPNSLYMEEKLTQLFQQRTTQKGNSDPFSVITIALASGVCTARDITSKNQITRLAQMLERVGHLSDALQDPSAYGRYALHLQGNLFVLVDGWADVSESERLAHKLIDALMSDRLSGERDYLPLCNIGVASYPLNGDSLKEVVYASRVAAQYGQSFGHPNSHFVARDLPPSGVLLEETAEEMRGNLTVLSSSVLMQSLRSSMRTGQLQVWSGNDGRTLRVLWEHGNPIQARFGSLSGSVAMIEYLVTCNRGEYAFRDRKLGGFTHVLKENLPFDKILLDAALASDFCDAAQKLIDLSDNILGADQTLAELADGWKDLECSEAEFEFAKRLIASAPQASTVGELKAKLSDAPDYRFWRVIHLLLKSGHIGLTKSLSKV